MDVRESASEALGIQLKGRRAIVRSLSERVLFVYSSRRMFTIDEANYVSIV